MTHYGVYVIEFGGLLSEVYTTTPERLRRSRVWRLYHRNILDRIGLD